MSHAAIDALCTQLRAGPAQTAGSLVVVPLYLVDSPTPPLWLRPGGTAVTLTSALARGDAEVVELDGGGSVPTLKVLNRGNLPVLLLDGEELVGAKQNRILNASVLVPAGADLEVPVSCVEKGRWRSVSKAFGTRSRSMPAKMRMQKTMRVSASLAGGRGHDAGQSQVWAEVDEYAARRGVHSPTGALGDVFDADREALNEAKKTLKAQPGQVGIAAWLNGELLGVEVLFSHEILAEAFDRLVHSYVSEALVAGRSPDRSATVTGTIPELMRAVSQGDLSRHDSPGVGTDLRVKGREGNAAALLDDQDRLVHVVVYGAAA